MSTDRRTDVTKLTVAFRNFVNALEKAHFGSRMNSKEKNIFKEPAIVDKA